MLESILAALARFIKLWWDAEEKKRLEWDAKVAAGRVESMKEVKAVEAEIRSVKPPAVSSVGAWNRGAKPIHPTTALLVLLFALAGCCGNVYVESAWPIIERPPRPALTGPDDLTDRESLLANYAITLEARIDKYNSLAHEHNRENGYE